MRGRRDTEDLTNRQFGRLTVTARAEATRPALFWRCKCACGGESVVMAANLRRGGTKSCGCIKRGVSDDILETYREMRLAHLERTA